MSSPITWRNVEAPDLRGASSMLHLAGTSINSGFDKLNQVLQNEQATADANWKVQRDNNTQAFLNSINQYRTPEEYQAALASGALSTDKYGAQIDQAAARSALDGRLSVLQDRAVRANQHADQQKEYEARPIVDQLQAMSLSDDKDLRRSAKEALGIYAGHGMVPKAAELAGKILVNDRQFTDWGHADTRAAQGTEKHAAEMALQPGRLQAQQDAHLNSVAQRNVWNAQAENQRAEAQGGGSVTSRAEQRLLKELAERNFRDYRETGMFGKGFSDNPTTNVSNIKNEVVSKHFGNKDTEGTRAIMEVLHANPEFTYGSGDKAIRVGVPPAAVQKALEITKVPEGYLGGMVGGGYTDSYKKEFKANLDKIMSSDEVWKEYTTYNALRANHLEGGMRGVGIPDIPKPATQTESPAVTAPPVGAIDRAAAAVSTAGALGIGKDGTPARDAAAAQARNSLFGPRVAVVPTVANGPESIADLRNLAKKEPGVTNAPVEQPKVSAPLAGNVGQAKIPTVASHTVAYNELGAPVPVNAPPPPKAAIKSLSSTPEEISTYKGSIPKGEATKVRVTIGDGDTFKFTPTDPSRAVPNAVGNICRFDVIDAPETAKPSLGKRGQPGAEEATAYLRKLMDNKEVSIKVFDQDKRKDNGPARNICQVEIEGKAIDLEMVKAGFAHVFDRYINKDNPRYSDLKKAEQAAQTNRLGIFKDGYAQPGWEFREKERKLGR